MFTKKKKIFLISAMVLLLVATAVVNVVLNKNIVNTSAEVSSAGFFESYRQDRETSRAQEILYLDAIIADESVSAETKASAEAQKLQLVNNMDLELVCENLIKSAGFKDVIMTTGGNYYNVVVDQPTLTASEVAVITDIVKTQASTDIDNIVITPIS